MRNRSLRIGLYGHGVAFSGKSLENGSLGGSETMYVQMAEALVKRGHNVTVLTLGGEECVVGGVTYLDYNTRRDYALGCLEYDVFLVGRDYSKLTGNVRTKLLGLWNHDILNDGTSFLEAVYATDFVFCLSKFHRQLFLERAKEAAPLITLTRNAIDLKRLDSASTGKRFPQTFIYGSRPERGLLYLLHSVWPRIVERLPEAVLYLAGYHIDDVRLPDHVRRVHDACDRQLDKSRNVVHLGSLTKDEWYKALWSAQVMLYPTDFPEISCLNVIEAQAAGVVTITTDDFALPECVSDPRNLIPGRPNEEVYTQLFVERAIRAAALYESGLETKARTEARRAMESRYQMDVLAEQWESYFWHRFEMRATRESRKIITQLIHHSDLLAVKWIIENTDLAKDSDDQMDQVLELLEDQHSEPEQYSVYVDPPESELKNIPTRMERALLMIEGYLKEKRETLQVIDHKPKRAFAAINDQAIAQAEAEAQNPFEITSLGEVSQGPYTLLDIGCGGGRFILGLLSKFGHEIIPYGLDFSSGLINSTASLLESQGYPDVREHLVNGDLEDYFPDFPFDIIFVGEWLEHQQDLYGMLAKIFSLVKPGGLVVFTVPSGPWESLSYGTTFNSRGKELRFHVSHFELRDILELFHDLPHQIVFDPLSVSPSDGALLGNWVVGVVNNGGAIQEIDYVRKFLTTRPYRTVAATIISKNAEDSIVGMLKTMERHVDQVIVYDTGSVDTTRDLVKNRKGITLIQGEWHDDFAQARNEAVCYVSPDTDWIFWMDCDEKLVSGMKLRKYTESLLYEGFVILQHHFSLDADQAPDVPVRLYKHHRNYRFFGKIHEQVQVSLNEPIHPTLIIPDVHVAHFGYLTEGERRAKVQMRNLPLLFQDRKENPERHLGAILLMRDLLQMISWTMEARQSQDLDEPMIQKLWEAVSLFEPFKHPSHLYHGVGWPHYQLALQTLGKHGLTTRDGHTPFALCFKMDYAPDAAPATVWFQSHEELEAWVAHRLHKLRQSLALE